MGRKLLVLLAVPLYLWQMFVTYFPDPIGRVLRYWFWKRRVRHMGRSVRIDVGVEIRNPRYVSLGDSCWLDRDVLILAGPPRPGRPTHYKPNPDFQGDAGDVTIGANVHIAPRCLLSGMGGLEVGDDVGLAAGTLVYSYSHHYRNLDDPEDRRLRAFTPLAPDERQAMIEGPVVIGELAAIGLRCVVLPGTSIGRGCWASAGCVLSGRYPDKTLLRLEQTIREKSLSDFEL